MQEPAAARDNAKGPTSGDSEPFRVAVPQTAAPETLFSCSTPETFFLLADRSRVRLDLNQCSFRPSNKDSIFLRGTRIEQIVVLQL
jgi:hypothetical protein